MYSQVKSVKYAEHQYTNTSKDHTPYSITQVKVQSLIMYLSLLDDWCWMVRLFCLQEEHFQVRRSRVCDK